MWTLSIKMCWKSMLKAVDKMQSEPVHSSMGQKYGNASGETSDVTKTQRKCGTICFHFVTWFLNICSVSFCHGVSLKTYRELLHSVFLVENCFHSLNHNLLKNVKCRILGGHKNVMGLFLISWRMKYTCNNKCFSIVEDKSSKIIRNILTISKKYEFVNAQCDLFISSGFDV